MRELAEAVFHPALAHGDCAPWNAKISNGACTLLDWERGELAGIPGWDWFHFVIQPAVLVRHEPVMKLIDRLEQAVRLGAFYPLRAAGGHRSAGNARWRSPTWVVAPGWSNKRKVFERVESLEHAAQSRWFPALG